MFEPTNPTMTVGNRLSTLRRMLQRQRRCVALGPILYLAAMFSVVVAPAVASAQTFSVIHAFHGTWDGANPSGLRINRRGNLVGMAFTGGSFTYGTVFRLNTASRLSVLYSFMGFFNDNAAFPAAGVIPDDAGNLYGTTTLGGASASEAGTVFKLDGNGAFTVLYSFCSKPDCSDGKSPASNLVRDPSGNLFGTAMSGGNCFLVGGCGVVFRLGLDGKYKILHNFTGGADGATPAPGGGLILDQRGNLYGTASQGGDVDCSYLGSHGCGTVFRIDPSGVFTVLHTFAGPDGSSPAPDLALDPGGNIYGATNGGGTPRRRCLLAGGCGVVFTLTSAGVETILHSFCSSPSCDEGADPMTGVAITADGSLYGTTNFGANETDWGTVFKLKGGKLTTLHNFTGGHDGATPQATPVLDRAGNVYGATVEGGHLHACQFGCGVLYEIAAPAS